MRKKNTRKPRKTGSLDSIQMFYEYDLHLESRTIYVGSVFTQDEDSGGESGVDSELAQRVIKALHILSQDNKTPIRLILNNPGGYIEQGMAIYDAIRACEATVTIEVFGQAMSMGSIILQAGNKRLLHPNAVVMVHDGTAGYSGIAKSFEAWAEYSKVSREQAYKIYAKRSRKPASYWRTKCASDFIMTAEQAVKEGLADGIIYTTKKL